MSYRCYVCAKPIDERVALVSPATDTDRAFLVHNDSVCLDQVCEDAGTIMLCIVEGKR